MVPVTQNPPNSADPIFATPCATSSAFDRCCRPLIPSATPADCNGPTNAWLVNWQPWSIGPIKLGATVGVMDGYPSLAKGGTFFAALPMATWEGKRYGVNVGVIPSIGKVDGAVIVQFKLRVY